ncbi:endonuclease/exonuclease/phosphatase family protein [Leucobacter sp. USHLN153]|uniref:endonuclease/exonuclease/phosphatase family protein n=1 Tax=Leucobacter sp. USHLN153 TaxID=3081268 RepID=UPI0030166DAA
MSRDADPAPAEALRVMTFNIRRKIRTWRREDRWRVRKPRVRAVLQRERPAVLGVQEALAGQARWVLESLGPGYRMIGRGRDADGQGEGCPVYFDNDRVELLDWRQIALSATPETPGSRAWGNLVPRVAVVADFRDRLTGEPFRFVNTHLDQLSSHSRVHSAELLRQTLSSHGAPAILTGDFNTPPGSRPITVLLEGGALRDAWREARLRTSPEYRSFANYRTPRPGRRIDWIVVTEGVAVDRIGMLGEPVLGGWASDHLPIVADVRLGAGE